VYYLIEQQICPSPSKSNAMREHTTADYLIEQQICPSASKLNSLMQ
jgi:hypothetical protein